MPTNYTVSNINIGTNANDGTGDPLRTAFNKINSNFANVFTLANIGGYAGGIAAGYYDNVISNLIIAQTANIVNANLNIAFTRTLSNLQNSISSISNVDIPNLSNTISNLNYVSVSSLNNTIANLNLTSLPSLGNSLANLNLTFFRGYSNIASSPLVANLTTPGTANGQQVLNTSDNGLYVWNGIGWISPKASFTPNASSMGTVEVWSGASLPSANIFTGRTILWTVDNHFYINVGGAWNNYNSYIQGTGNATIGANSINSAALLDNVITADKIVAGVITAEKIATATITSAQLAADAVTSFKVSANAITAGKIDANAVGVLQITANAITSDKILANAVTSAKLSANAVTAEKIDANAITTNKILAGAVTAEKIFANTITSNQIAAGAITSDKIALEAITGNKIFANTITAAKIAPNTITADKFVANTISSTVIDSRNLTIQDSSGNVIFGGGVTLNTPYITANAASVGFASGEYTNAVSPLYTATSDTTSSGEILTINSTGKPMTIWINVSVDMFTYNSDCAKFKTKFQLYLDGGEIAWPDASTIKQEWYYPTSGYSTLRQAKGGGSLLFRTTSLSAGSHTLSVRYTTSAMAYDDTLLTFGTVYSYPCTLTYKTTIVAMENKV